MDNDLGYFVYRKCNTDDSNIDFGLLNQQRMFDANHHYIYNRQKEMVYGDDKHQQLQRMEKNMRYKDNVEKYSHINAVKDKIMADERFTDISVNDVGNIKFGDNVLIDSRYIYADDKLGTNLHFIPKIETSEKIVNVYDSLVKYYAFDYRTPFDAYIKSSVKALENVEYEFCDDYYLITIATNTMFPIQHISEIRVYSNRITVDSDDVLYYPVPSNKDEFDKIVTAFWNILKNTRRFVLMFDGMELC